MEKLYGTLSLSGEWEMNYLSENPYTGEGEPSFSGYPVKDAVGAYWEDMTDKFRESPIHTLVKWNPLYTLQRYPQAGYVPDMALPNIYGTFGYKRVINIGSDIPEDGIELYCGGVQNRLSAWVNGVYIGTHEGYSSEFSLPLPKGLLVRGENRITLAVSNNRLEGYMQRPVSGCTSRAANECTGGIYGDLEFRVYMAPVRSVYVTTSPDTSEFTVHTVGGADTVRQVRIKDGESLVGIYEIKRGEQSVTVPTEGFEFWSPKSPRLYSYEVECEGRVLVGRFGIRRLTSVGRSLYLNGRPFYARAICEHGYYPMTAHPPRDKKYYRKGLKRLKELGFNMVRFHTWVPMAEYMEAADELGVLIEVETPNNTSYSEWEDIIRYARKYTSVVAYSSGNEMVIDEDYIEHLSKVSAFLHKESDSLMSPMSAMRGVEYHSFGDDPVEKPFLHNPRRLAMLSKICDFYNSYSLGSLSYSSETADYKVLNERHSVYDRPILSHEIGINGTYVDLSLKDRYKGTRIGETELFSSVEKHLTDKGLIDRAPIYYANSSEWQRRLRKHCFESARRTETVAGYDYLGDIDHHWHTFGYCVGMMNEFYELKPGETVENVRRYNGDSVLLADLPHCLNLECAEKLSVPILLSHYGPEIERATLRLRLTDGDTVYLRKEVKIGSVASGTLTELYVLEITAPKLESPKMLKLYASLGGDDTDVNSVWELYVFPKADAVRAMQKAQKNGVTVSGGMKASELVERLKRGERVAIFGTEPFAKATTSFQISLAGRTTGHLATLIADTPLMDKFPHEGFCSWQFREMMNGGASVLLDIPSMPYEPIIEIASAYKNARREALVCEYKFGEGKLFVCGLNMRESDPGARWLKARMLSYVYSKEFDPEITLTEQQLLTLTGASSLLSDSNTNEARNLNDITML